MTDSENKIILRINSLLIGYRKGKEVRPLLHPLNICAERGELIAVIGANGTGKSTLLKTIAGLLPPLGGEILIDGRNLKEYTRGEIATKSGFVSTEQVKVDNMKVTDLIELGRYPYTSWTGRLKEKDYEMINCAVEKTGLKNMAQRFINELSDGERQKAMIARLIAQDTDIMIMDEPTAFLDIRHRYEIIHLLRTLSAEKNKTILFSTHDLPVVINECDRVWLIAGQNVFDGAPEDIVLKGLLNKLFSDEDVVFNPYDANFGYKKEFRKEINIYGNGFEKHWTEKAFNRAGFRCVSNKTDNEVTVAQDSEGLFWIYCDKNTRSLKLRSVYDLLKWINTLQLK